MENSKRPTLSIKKACVVSPLDNGHTHGNNMHKDLRIGR